jgi:hypothetical protein
MLLVSDIVRPARRLPSAGLAHSAEVVPLYP